MKEFRTLEEARQELFYLDKYYTELVLIDGERVLMCGTPLAFDDEIEGDLYDIFVDLAYMNIGSDTESYDIYVDLYEDEWDTVKDIASTIIETFKKKHNLRIEYVSTEF